MSLNRPRLTDTAMACDFVIASEAAQFAWSYIHRGIVADGGGMYFLPRRVGLSRAKELIFSGRTVSANEALQLGIADRLAAPDQLLTQAQAWARELSHGSPAALGLSKGILNRSFQSSDQQVFAQGSMAQGMAYTSSEHRASVEAFLARSAARKAG